MQKQPFSVITCKNQKNSKWHFFIKVEKKFFCADFAPFDPKPQKILSQKII